MSRINEPVSFKEKIAEQTACYKKHQNDAGASVLNLYLTENNIDFAADVAAGAAAVVLDSSATSLIWLSEKATKDRDISYEPVWKETIAGVQFLKKLYKTNTKQLTDWGVPIDVNGNIDYPTPFTDRVAISKAVITKHNSYISPAISPLLLYITTNNVNITNMSAAIVSSLATDIIREERKADSVKATQDRDIKFAIPYQNLKSIGGFLMVLYPNNPKDVALWGFDEVDTLVPETLRTVTLLPLKSKKITGIKLGSVLKNDGIKDVSFTKGKKGLGAVTLVPAGTELGMNKGCSVIIVTNPATIGKAIVKVTIK